MSTEYFMCQTDYDYHLDNDMRGADAYTNIVDLCKNRPCVNSCGIVRFEVVPTVYRDESSDLYFMEKKEYRIGGLGGMYGELKDILTDRSDLDEIEILWFRIKNILHVQKRNDDYVGEDEEE